MTGSSTDGPDQEALFYIEGPDERGCVWAHGASSADPWTRNLGQQDKVAEVLSQWLRSIEHDEDGLQGSEGRLAEIEDDKRQAKRSRKAGRRKDDRDEGGEG